MRLVVVALLLALPMLDAGAACKFLKVASVQVLVDGNRIYLPGRVNDQEVLFTIDTGAEFSIMLPDGAKALGLGVGLGGGQMIGATGHELSIGRSHLDSLAFGAWSGHNIDMRVVGEGANFGRDRAFVLLGQDFLRHFDVEFDLKNGTITLFQPQDCAQSNLAYWNDSYNVADMLGTDPGSHHVIVAARVNDVEFRALLDSGAPFSLLSTAAAAQLGIDPDSPGVTPAGVSRGIGGVPSETWLASFASFTLDQETIRPAKLRFLRLAKTAAPLGSHIENQLLRIDMILGADFLRSHRLLIANSQRKVYFTYAGGAAFQSVGPRLPR